MKTETVSKPRKLKIARVWIEHKIDEHPDLANLAETKGKHEAEDKKRMEAYNRGDWHMIGIIAKAEIISPAGVVQTLRSGGLWSIESDSGVEYIASVESEQLAELRNELESLGMGKRSIDYAFRKVEKTL